MYSGVGFRQSIINFILTKGDLRVANVSSNREYFAGTVIEFDQIIGSLLIFSQLCDGEVQPNILAFIRVEVALFTICA